VARFSLQEVCEPGPAADGEHAVGPDHRCRAPGVARAPLFSRGRRRCAATELVVIRPLKPAHAGFGELRRSVGLRRVDARICVAGSGRVFPGRNAGAARALRTGSRPTGPSSSGTTPRLGDEVVNSVDPPLPVGERVVAGDRHDPRRPSKDPANTPRTVETASSTGLTADSGTTTVAPPQGLSGGRFDRHADSRCCRRNR